MTSIPVVLAVVAIVCVGTDVVEAAGLNESCTVPTTPAATPAATAAPISTGKGGGSGSGPSTAKVGTTTPPAGASKTSAATTKATTPSGGVSGATPENTTSATGPTTTDTNTLSTHGGRRKRAADDCTGDNVVCSQSGFCKCKEGYKESNNTCVEQSSQNSGVQFVAKAGVLALWCLLFVTFKNL